MAGLIAYTKVSELPRDLQDNIIYAVAVLRPDLIHPMLKSRSPDTVFSLGALFAWKDTIQGFQYWSAVARQFPNLQITYSDICSK